MLAGDVAAAVSVDEVSQTHADQSSQALIIVDQGVENLEELLAAAPEDAKIILLDQERDPISQITSALRMHSELQSVHLVSHGEAGELILAGRRFDADALMQRQAELESWSDSLADGADLLIYGCDSAKGADGTALLRAFAELTGADVAGSIDKTGNQLYGGDWELEKAVGVIESSIVFDDTLRQRFKGVLDITINAAGSTGEEQFDLLIDGNVVASFALNGNSSDVFTYQTDLVPTGDRVRVQFTNDLFLPDQNIDRNLTVESISIDGQTFITDSPDVFSTGTWLPVEGIVPGFGRGNQLNSNGFFQYGSSSVSGSTIVVNASGDTGFEQFILQTRSQQFAATQVATFNGSYIFQANGIVDPAEVRVSFINDLFQPEFGIDNNLTVDNIVVDGVVFQTEASTVQSSGVFVPGEGFVDGFLQSETLHGNGFFAYGGQAGESELFAQDQTFGSNGSRFVGDGLGLGVFASVSTVAADGRIASFVHEGENFGGFNGDPRRFNVVNVLGADGTTDPTFNGGEPLQINPLVEAVIGAAGPDDNVGFSISEAQFDSQGRLVFLADRFLGDGEFAVITLNTDGSVASGFGGNVNAIHRDFQFDSTTRFAIDSQDRVVVTGKNVLTDEVIVARYLSDGQVDSSFGTAAQVAVSLALIDPQNGITEFVDIGIDADDSVGIVIDQRFRQDVTSGIVKLDSSGNFDTTFAGDGILIYQPSPNPNISEAYDELFFDSQGRVVISGPFGALRRFNADGSADTGFGDNGILSLPGVFTARDTEIDSQDRIVVLDDDFIIRIDSNGQLDASLSQDGFQSFEEAINIVSFNNVTSFDLVDDGLVFLSTTTPRVFRLDLVPV